MSFFVVHEVSKCRSKPCGTSVIAQDEIEEDTSNEKKEKKKRENAIHALADKWY